LNLLAIFCSKKKNNFVNYFFVFLRSLIFICLIIALARPRFGQDRIEDITNAIDIMIALDVSGSMMAEDYKPENRLEAAKKVTIDFIKNRKYDRLGLVVFGRGAYLKCPLTTDYNLLIDFIQKTKFQYNWVKQQNFFSVDEVAQPKEFHQGTFIASAIGTSVYHIKNSYAKSKVLILLTDGKQEGDEYDPVTIAEAAKKFNVKIYTVAVGTNKESVPVPIIYRKRGKVYQQAVVPIDEDVLKEIAKVTNGKFFKADDTESLKKIYKEIDKLEKTKIKIKKYVQYKEKYQIFLALAIIFLLLELLLKNTIFRKLPEI
jgi:Ca-activated chloride channel family protein